MEVDFFGGGQDIQDILVAVCATDIPGVQLLTPGIYIFIGYVNYKLK